MVNECKTNPSLIAAHGEKMKFGKIGIINGQRALIYYKGDKVVGYATFEEICSAFFRDDIPETAVDF